MDKTKTLKMKLTFLLILFGLFAGVLAVNYTTAAPSDADRMASYKVEQITDAPLMFMGEGPHWDVQRQSLYYINIYGREHGQHSVYRYDFREDKVYKALVEGENWIGWITPVEGSSDKFVVGANRRLLVIKWDGMSDLATVDRVLAEVESNKTNNRFNDGKADLKGRVFGGTMRLEAMGDIFEAREGSFYRFSPCDGIEMLRTNIGVSNGLTWNETLNKFYFIDSIDLDVKEFDYDPKTGNISNERVLIKLDTGERPHPFVPDGMTIDEDGNLYVANFGSSNILKINPRTKQIELDIKMPAKQVTSVAFGGPNLDILFATTSNKPESGPQPAPAGGVFKITGLGVKGKPMHNVRL